MNDSIELSPGVPEQIEDSVVDEAKIASKAPKPPQLELALPRAEETLTNEEIVDTLEDLKIKIEDLIAGLQENTRPRNIRSENSSGGKNE